jgi:hypothetical protein
MTADAGFIDEDGYAYVMARTDDIINVAGHRLSTGGMEEVLADHPDVAECAVLGVDDKLKGQVPVGFLVLNAGVERDHRRSSLRRYRWYGNRIGPVASFKTATVVKRLPKTRSGKILRGTIQKIADNKQWKMPATIDDPVILDEITDALQTIGNLRLAQPAPTQKAGTARCAHRPWGLSRLSAVINGSDADISPRLKAATDGLQPKRGCQHRFMHRDR